MNEEVFFFDMDKTIFISVKIREIMEKDELENFAE